MTEALPPLSTIGIIGGGQLGRMLASAAARLSYQVVILEPGAHCPAAQTANRQIEAAYDDPAALDELVELCDVVTYEFENVPVETAVKLAAKVPVFPPPNALEVSQDRLAEKNFLNDAGLSTAPLRRVDSDTDLTAALEAFGGEGVLKTRRLGYDGKGQKRFHSASSSQITGTFEQMGSIPLILEGFVPFEREISIIAARSKTGEFVAYEPAENVHRDGILHTSNVPASITSDIAAIAFEQAKSLMQALDYVGVIGIEFFVLTDGSLVANEFAPRVHNSGHWTEAACAISQFEQHIRAVTGLPLGDTARHSACVMENLIGDDVDRLAQLANEDNAVIHLYGKAEARRGRKMGHVTRIKPI